MIAAILGIIQGLLSAIPIFDKWFTKTATQKAEEAKKDAREAVDHARKTGRPKWD